MATVSFLLGEALRSQVTMSMNLSIQLLNE